MTAILDARNLSLEDVHRLLKLEESLNESPLSLLSLEHLTEFEQQEVLKIRDVFRSYYASGRFSEGQVKFLTIAPLMWLAGFYQQGIKITIEENIADISIEDEDTVVKGRMDILAVSRTKSKTSITPFWVLVVETKNSSIEALEGLPQLLTYAYKSSEHQESVWGLTTNGLSYWFVNLKQGNPPTYQLLPELNLFDLQRSLQLLQILKAICKLQYTSGSL
ncbi:hypothetical protein [Aliterella atlantica]|uniref:Restriction endonuclease, type I, EcoRI, R subunit/Type III n=1 Tax=Aliterella atlantica CENA595 TaxID=1618023 RepID=A0A0D8ZPP3_9CYAN|nr:hypothetical protein [Aliterella atlantica]KJH70484.1 Restriction endonuclease, type I, EcoRI, R subunit/Type III [Aliterella atlantica CENA595]